MKLSNPLMIRRIATAEITVRIELKVLEKRFTLSHSLGGRADTFGGSSLLEDSENGSDLNLFSGVVLLKVVIVPQSSF